MLKRKERATMSGKMYEKRPEEDARYHDTWRLLKKYRDVTWSLELSIRQVKNQFRIDYDCSIEDFLESIYMAGADLGGTDTDNAILLSAHIDTLGAMVAEIKGNGALRVRAIGGLTPANVETEHCKVYTRDGKTYDGTCQLIDASIHVNHRAAGAERTFDTMEVLLDEPVSGLDPSVTAEMYDLIYKLNGEDYAKLVAKAEYLINRFGDVDG